MWVILTLREKQSLPFKLRWCSDNWKVLTNRAAVSTEQYTVESNTVVVKNGISLWCFCPHCGHRVRRERGGCMRRCPHCCNTIWCPYGCRCWYYCPRCAGSFRLLATDSLTRPCPYCGYQKCYPEDWD